MRDAVLAVLLVAAVVAAGCIPSQKLAEGEIDRCWFLQPDVWPTAERQEVKLGQSTLPTRWVFRQEPSVIWSTVSMVRAVDALKAGTDEFNVGVSPVHADMLADILADARATVEDLRRIADPSRSKEPRELAAALAEALVSSEKVVRRASDDEAGRATKTKDDPFGWTAGPVLQMLAAYMDDRSGGGLLAAAPGSAGTVRQTLVQVVVRLGFAAAGKQDPRGLSDELASRMQSAEDPAALKGELTDLLAERIGLAAPAAPGSPLPGLLHGVLAVAPRALEVMEYGLRQWDKLESVELEFRRAAGEPVVSVTVRVKAGREVRLLAMAFMQPTLAFRGATRITVLPKAAGSKETAVLFEPLGADGSCQLRFDNPLYGLVRLLAIPLDNSALREVRVSAESGSSGRLTSVTLVMESLSDRRDPRRIMMLQDVRGARMRREAFQVRRTDERSEQVFNYITPTRRYTYHRVKAPQD